MKYRWIYVWRLQPSVLVADIAEHHVTVEAHLYEVGAAVEENRRRCWLDSFRDAGAEGGFRISDFQGDGVDK